MTNDVVHPLRSSRLSLSAQAQKYLLSLVENGTYQPGEQLPSEADLAAQLGISRPTLREALMNLEQEGILIRKHGVGTFVAPGYDHRLESGLERLESVLELAARQGLRVKVDDLNVDQEPADAEMAEKLQVEPGALLTSIHRAIVVDGRPAAYMLDVIPSATLAPADLDETFDGSVLDLLKQKLDLSIFQAVANIVATNAGSFLSRKLEVKPQQALLLLEETLFDDEGSVVEFSRNYFIPACFRFHVVRR
jgi:GntR family transcriptional regulator